MPRLIVAAFVLLVLAPSMARAAEFALYDESHALLIGVSDYTNGWPKLKGVPEDIKAVAAALEKIGFTTEVVMDPDRAGLDGAMTGFIARYGARLGNRLLFYYAGHGHTLTTSYGGEMGYIVPRDAPDPSKDRAGFMGSAIGMQRIEEYARQIEAKHALFVFDSCFSGSVFFPTRAIPEVVQEKSTRPVRQFITSGAADQPVPDSSVFRREFIAAITGEAGQGKDGYLTGSQLGMYLEDKVTAYSRRTQTPQYGKLQDPNLNRGDFIFILPKVAPGSSATIPPPPPVSSDADIVFWQSITASSSAADFEEYLRQFPQGRFAGLARNRLATLRGPTPAQAAAAVAVPKPAPSVAAVEALNKGSEAAKRNDFADAMRWYRTAADQGFARAQYNIGQLYQRGQGVSQDNAEAMGWYRQAAAQGDAFAQTDIGVSYEIGRGVARDYAEAARWYRQAAEQGNVGAQTNIGRLYHNGWGVTRDYAEAMRWYRKAADQGNAYGQYNISLLYAKGLGVALDYAEAMRWLRKSADQGNAAAQRDIGALYEFGRGVSQDYAEAMRWYRQAAGQGDALAQSSIGVLYEFGRGVVQDYAEAMRWYRKAADQGNAAAQRNIGLLYGKGLGVAQNDAEAMGWLLKAADQGNADAQRDIALRYGKGLGVAQDYTEAMHWFRKAADLGNVSAQHDIGVHYANGWGVPRDLAQARVWMQKAAAGGDENAKQWLAEH